MQSSLLFFPVGRSCSIIIPSFFFPFSFGAGPRRPAHPVQVATSFSPYPGQCVLLLWATVSPRNAAWGYTTPPPFPQVGPFVLSSLLGKYPFLCGLLRSIGTPWKDLIRFPPNPSYCPSLTSPLLVCFGESGAFASCYTIVALVPHCVLLPS